MAPQTSSTDWTTSYSQYLSRSAAVSAQSLNLYQLALERVSQGKLPATIFQDYFPTFALSHGPEFANRFAELGSRFLSDLVRLGGSFAHNGTDREPEPVAPRFDTSNPARWYEQVAEYAGQMNARAIKAYRTQLDRVATGDTTPSEVQQQTAEQMAQELPSHMQLITRLYFDLLNGLTDVRSAYEETYFRGLLGQSKAEDSYATVTITLTGPTGSTSAASMAITNTTAQRTRIGYRILDLRRVDGVGPSFLPAVTLLPESLELDPGQEGTLILSIVLDSEHFETGALYSGALLLIGGSDVPLHVDLRILATGGAPGSSNGKGLL